MKLSREARRIARQLFASSMVQGRLDQSRSLMIADTIIAMRPRHAFEIIKEFTRLTRLYLNMHQAVIESALPLDSTIQAEIAASLQRHDDQVNISILVNPSLLGGTRIRLGSNVWDGSVAAKLQSLKNN